MERSPDDSIRMPRELKAAVRKNLDNIRFWDQQRESGISNDFAVGDRVWYKDERIDGIITEMLDGEGGRKSLVGRKGALVSFKNRTAVPVFCWALRRPEADS